MVRQNNKWSPVLWAVFGITSAVGGMLLVYIFAPSASDRTKIFTMLSIGNATAPFVELLCSGHRVFIELCLAYCAYIIILILPSYILSGMRLGFIYYSYETPMTTLVFPMFVVYYFVNRNLRLKSGGF
jgi:hypothetical protein